MADISDILMSKMGRIIGLQRHLVHTIIHLFRKT
jgi:hypothetical protein